MIWAATPSPLPKEKTADGKLDSYVGKKVKMGIRPEDIDDEPEFMAKHPDCHLETQVDVSEMMGAEIYLYLEYKGNKMTARVAPTSKARNGDTVRVAFDPHKVPCLRCGDRADHPELIIQGSFLVLLIAKAAGKRFPAAFVVI